MDGYIDGYVLISRAASVRWVPVCTGKTFERMWNTGTRQKPQDEPKLL
jgi:hypothetical protein